MTTGWNSASVTTARPHPQAETYPAGPGSRADRSMLMAATEPRGRLRYQTRTADMYVVWNMMLYVTCVKHDATLDHSLMAVNLCGTSVLDFTTLI